MRALMWIRTVSFLAVLVCPLPLMLRPSPAMTNEKRTLAARPLLSELDKNYPERFDAYFRDHFGGRDRLIRWHHRVKYELFRESPVDQVLVGREGWLFYSYAPAGPDIKNFAGRWPHTTADIDRWLAAQDERERRYAAEGAKYLIVIAPDKQTLYPEFVPYRYGPQAPGIFDEVLARLEFHPRLRLLDLRPVLRRRKDAGLLYYMGDAHWNQRGAFYAAQAVADTLRPDFPNIGLIRDADYDIRRMAAVTGELSTMLAIDTGIQDYDYVPIRLKAAASPTRDRGADTIWEQADKSMPRAVLIGDSFTIAIAWTLANSFSRMYIYQTTMKPPYPGIVHDEHPDVVILMLVERDLPRLFDQ